MSCTHSLPSEIDQAADLLLEAGAVGISTAMFNENGLVWSASYGFADSEQQKPMTSTTLMNIASISKPFTGSSAMLLVQQGKLNLDTDINHYLPFEVHNPGHPEAVITLRQLLTHTASISDQGEVYFSADSYHYGGDNPISLEEFLYDYFSADGQYFSADNFDDQPPGTHRIYSSIGFGLIGYLVEVVSGQPLNEFTARHFFQPLQMNDTGWMLSEIDPIQHASLYEISDGIPRKIEWYGLATWPDGGLRTHVEDLARFYVAMMNHDLVYLAEGLVRESYLEMFSPQFASGQVLESVADHESERQALAWNYSDQGFEEWVLGHGGGDPGVSTYAYFFPERKSGIILLVNTSSDESRFYDAFDALKKSLFDAARSDQR
jgi:CubicO group peptidase (beta-lactamase class C family)